MQLDLFEQPPGKTKPSSIRRLKETNYRFKLEQKNEPELLWEKTQPGTDMIFTPFGSIQEMIFLRRNRQWKRINRYDNFNRKIETLESTILLGYDMIRNSYTYDENNRVVIEETSKLLNPRRALELFSLSETKYFRQKKETKTRYINQKSRFFELYRYDSFGNVVEEKTTCGQELIGWTKTIFDLQGRKQLIMDLDKNARVVDSTYFTFDEHGNFLSESCNGQIVREHVSYKYDEKRQGWESFYVIRGKHSRVFESFFSNGLPKVYEYESNGKHAFKEYEYEFDNRGNWINEQVIYNGEPHSLRNRMIEYFPEEL